MKMKKLMKGFTLIELLIVIAIIGILAVAFVPVLTQGPQKARDSTRSVNLSKIATALEVLQVDTNVYPLASGLADDGCVGDGTVFLTPGDYFPGGVIPEDVSGLRTGLTDDPGGCVALGFVYMRNLRGIGGNYVLATIKEDPAQNNSLFLGIESGSPDSGCAASCTHYIQIY